METRVRSHFFLLFALSLLVLFLVNCRKELAPEKLAPVSSGVSVLPDEAQKLYEAINPTTGRARKRGVDFNGIHLPSEPLWDRVEYFGKADILSLPLVADRKTGTYEKALFFRNKQHVLTGMVMKTMTDPEYMRARAGRSLGTKSFTGQVHFFSLAGNYITGYNFSQGGAFEQILRKGTAGNGIASSADYVALSLSSHAVIKDAFDSRIAAEEIAREKGNPSMPSLSLNLINPAGASVSSNPSDNEACDDHGGPLGQPTGGGNSGGTGSSSGGGGGQGDPTPSGGGGSGGGNISAPGTTNPGPDGPSERPQPNPPPGDGPIKNPPSDPFPPMIIINDPTKKGGDDNGGGFQPVSPQVVSRIEASAELVPIGVSTSAAVAVSYCNSDGTPDPSPTYSFDPKVEKLMRRS